MAEPHSGDDPPPIPPAAPQSGDCCHGGCDPCVFDLYDEELTRYEAELKRWQLGHGPETVTSRAASRRS